MRYSAVEIENEIRSYTNKPLVYSGGHGYPYHGLTDRQFEALLYSIFKSDIENGQHGGEFDDVSLMTGVGERGRDCGLYYRGDSVGLVQCKHSINPATRVNKPSVAHEIIKFALHYLQDKSVISDLNNFTYYFVVSADFAGTAIDLLSDFNRRITSERQFEMWVKQVIREYQAFKVFTFDAIKDELSTVLRSITVKRMNSADLNLKLADYPRLVSLFFSVEKVISAEDAQEIREEMKQATQAILTSQSRIERVVTASCNEVLERTSNVTMLIEREGDLLSDYQGELDYAQGLLDGFMPNQALQYLDSLKERIWDQASANAKYRLLALMGLAHLNRNQEPIAAQMLIDAFSFNPSSAKATCNAALGFLLIGENERCRQLAHQALEKDPSLPQAYSMLVHSCSHEESFDSILARIPEAYQDSPEVAMALGNLAGRRQLLPEAEHWLRVATKADARNHPDLRGKLATVLLIKIMEDHQATQMRGFANPHFTTLSEIVELYSYVWERLSGTEMRPYRVEWLVNRATARAWLGDMEGASQDLDDALQEEPDAPHIIGNRAILAYQSGDLLKAASLLRRILDSAPKPDAKFWLSVVLFEDGKLDQAEALIREVMDESESSLLTWDATGLLIFIKLQLRDLPEARKLANSLMKKFPDDPDTLTLCARVARHEGKSEEVETLLAQAQSALTSEASVATRYRLAEELYENEMFEAAADLLEQIVDTQVDSSPTRQLLTCHYRSGNLKPALDICKTLREKHGPLQFVTEMETAIYEEIDDLHLARQVCEDYLKSYPDDLSVELRLAVMNYRLKEFESLDGFLEKDIDVQRLSFEGYAQIAFLLLLRGYAWQALNVAYEARRRFFDNPNAHQLYVSKIFLRIGLSEKHDWLDVDQVGVDTAVCITDQDGAHPRWITIEERDDADVQRGELTLEHPLVKKLLNKEVNESITIAQGSFTQEVRVKQIKSKFVHAFHESMSIYQTTFPDKPGMWQFPVRYSADGVPTRETFRPLFDSLDQQKAFSKDAMRVYEQGSFTIGALAGVLGKNPIEVQGMLTGKAVPGVRCCSGRRDERQEAVVLADPKSALVIDAITLMTIHQLGIGDAISDAYSEVGVVRTTLDPIEQLLEDELIHSKEYMSFCKVGGQYTPFLVTEELVKQGKRELESVLAWAETNCTILPCRAALGIRREARRKLGELIGPSFVDTVLVAADENMVLYSDDMTLRNLAKVEYNVPGVWTQAVLLRLKEEGLVSDDLYREAVVKLACLHYHHTSIDAQILLEAAKLAEWRPAYPFSEVTEVLSGRHSDLESSVWVATAYVRILWQQNLLPVRYENLVIAVLDAISSDRNLKDRQLAISRFEDEMAKKLYLAPLAVNQIRGIVQVWRSTHIL